MAKAIKHIRAGLLHIELIGQVPERGGRKPRAARSRPTSAAKAFYNLKTAWRELELRIAANFQGRDFVITFTYDDAHLPKDKDAASKELQKFLRRLRSARRRRGEELKYIYCTEGSHGMQEDEYLGTDGALENKRLHHHVIINGTGSGWLDEVRSLWHGGGYVRAEPVDVHYYRELAKYLTKEARDGGGLKPGKHSWSTSRNLTKYEVQYEEISSNSVTLAAPPGAVDYQSFAEKNPYGFADCIGARYLLYEDVPNPGYSYTRGRQRKKE